MEYTVTKDGEVYNLNGRKLKPYQHSDGYRQFKMYDGGCNEAKYVHRFVYETYVGPIPKNMQINHINEDKSDNRLENLELVTHEQNIRKRSYCKLNMETCQEIRRRYTEDNTTSVRSLSKEYGAHESTIHNCLRGKTWN